MHRYRIKIYWSDEDQSFIAEVPELPGCMTHGRTKASARANAFEAIQSWIDTANEFSDPIPEPKGERVTSNSYVAAKYNRSSVRSRNPLSIFSPKAPQLTVNPKAH